MIVYWQAECCSGCPFSCRNLNNFNLRVEYEELSAAQQSDPETDAAKSSITDIRCKTIKIS